MADKSGVAEAIAELEEETREEVSEAIEDGLAAAEERVEAAQETAQAVIDAALQTEIGRQVADIRTENERWRNEIQTSVSELMLKVSSLAETLETLRTPVILQPTPQASVTQSSSTLPPSSEVIQEAAEMSEVIPEAIIQSGASGDGLAEAAEQVNAPPRKRRRFL